MKPYTYSLLAAIAATGLASAADTAYTTPVGYVSLGDTTGGGNPAIKASTDVAVSIPLQRPTEYAGVVASTTSGSITLGGTTPPVWTANQWAPGAATPYLVSVKSGTEAGFVGLITANTADTLTVTPVTGGSLTNVLANDEVIIHKAWTIISLFPSGTFPAGVRVLAYSGSASGINLPPDLNYLWNGTNFTKSGVISNNDILYSGESFIIRTITTAVTSLTIAGEVPVVKSRTNIDKLTVGVAQDNRVSYYSPVDEIIGNSGLSAILGAGDRVLAFDNSASGTNKPPTENILWNGTNFTLSGSPVTTTYTLKGGRGYLIRRLQTAPVGPIDWKDEQTYVPTL
jgi:uncharacterized protein (TIGR02597 family)